MSPINNTKKLENMPPQFIEHIQSCSSIGIDFSNCDIEIEEYERILNHNYNIVENRINVTIKEKTSFEEKTIQFSYTKNINYNDFVDEFKNIQEKLKIEKEKYIEDFIEKISKIDSVYRDEIISEYIRKHKCEFTSENILKALTEEAEVLYNDEIKEYQEMLEIYNNIENSSELNIESDLHTDDIDISYFGSTIKGGIFAEDGKFILFELVIDENKKMDTIKVDVYDSISEVANVSDDYSIDYKTISRDFLQYNGVKPLYSKVFSFNQLLNESNIETTKDNPIIATYKLKDYILDKILKNSNLVKSIS